MHTARKLYTMLASMVFVAIPLPTQASPQLPTCASIESESVACSEVTRNVDHEITIDGHTFGPTDNLQEHTLTVSPSDNSERGARDWGIGLPIAIRTSHGGQAGYEIRKSVIITTAAPRKPVPTSIRGSELFKPSSPIERTGP